MRHPPIRSLILAASLLLGIAVACGSPTGLLPVNYDNVVDTVSLYALRGTPISQPSAYVVRLGPSPVRTDQTNLFDFAFDIDTLDRPVLLPTGAVRLGRASGLQLRGEEFDSLKIAPVVGYTVDSAVVVEEGSVLVVHSRPTDCGAVGLSPVYNYYAKLHVLKIDPVARRIDFEILVDQNCGYRGLEPGRPTR